MDKLPINKLLSSIGVEIIYNFDKRQCEANNTLVQLSDIKSTGLKGLIFVII
jgi:hypothetical protein